MSKILSNFKREGIQQVDKPQQNQTKITSRQERIVGGVKSELQSSTTRRQEANYAIVQELFSYFAQNPNVKFVQGLINMNIVRISDSDKKSLVNNSSVESATILKRLKRDGK